MTDKIVFFYPQSPEVELWVSKLTYSPPSPSSPHHQLLDADMNFVDSVGLGGGGVGGVGWGGVALFLNVIVFKGFLEEYFLLKGCLGAFAKYISYQKGLRGVLIRIFLY